MRGNYLRLCQKRFKLGIRKLFFVERVVNYWNRLSRGVMESLSRGVMESPSLEVFQECVDITPENII